jgi:hypothetical protein
MQIPSYGNVPAMPINASSMIQEVQNANDTKIKTSINNIPTLPQSEARTRNQPVDKKQYQPQLSHKEEQQILHSPNFNAKAFISKSLSGATDTQVSKFAEKLVSLQEQLVIDRKDMIYGNYKTFLTVGTQISVLGTELQTLRKLVNDFHVATTAMKEDAEQYLTNAQGNISNEKFEKGQNQRSSLSGGLFPGRGLPANGRQNNRNSVLMLENMWAQDLNKLFKMVEGAQKYFPATAGRHVLMESSGWYQLHAATWKPLQPIHVVLLNDHLLMATKKRHRNDNSLNTQPSQNFVADMCWPLSEINIEDLSKSENRNMQVNRGQTLTGFSVTTGNATFVYKTESVEALKKVISTYQRAIKDLNKPNGNSREGGTARKPEKRGHSRHTSFDVSERARNLREVDDLINDLDVKIAHRKFKDAVTVIQKSSRETADIGSIPATVVSAAQAGPAALAIGNNFSISSSSSKSRKGSIALNTTTLVNTDIKTLRSQILKVKLDERIKELTDILLADISQDYLGPTQMKSHIQLLIRLGQPEAVKKAFLGSRRQLINKRIKRVEFKGDISAYIAQIATIHFRMIRTTVDIYQACYPQNEYASSIVEWAKAEVEDFVVTFARQLYNVEPKSDIYIQCANITKEQSAQLTKVGLNLDFLLDYIYEGPKK